MNKGRCLYKSPLITCSKKFDIILNINTMDSKYFRLTTLHILVFDIVEYRAAA